MKRNNIFLEIPKDSNMYRQAKEIFEDNKKLGELGFTWKSTRDVLWAAMANGLDSVSLSVYESLEMEQPDRK